MPYLPIHHTFGPHADLRTVGMSLKLLLQPWKWRSGTERDALKLHLSRSFEGHCTLFGSGREGLMTLLRSAAFPSGSEVIIQGFTCIAVPNAVHAAKLVPIYADIDKETLNLSVDTVRKHITPRTKAIICQHTFGIPADTEALSRLCKEYQILLIEDCAHVLPDVTGPKQIGTFSDALMLSFGRDKAVSGIAGGAIIVKNTELARTMEEVELNAKELDKKTIGRLLLYPITYYKARLTYGLGIGKLALLAMKKLGLLIPVLKTTEKHGVQSPVITKMPNACAALALAELKTMHRINNHRRLLTGLYMDRCENKRYAFPSAISKDLPLQKFPLYVGDADAVRAKLKHHNIHLDDGWTGAIVCPRSCDQHSAQYRAGTCPIAELVSKEVLSLPTHLTMSVKQAETVMNILESTLS